MHRRFGFPPSLVLREIGPDGKEWKATMHRRTPRHLPLVRPHELPFGQHVAGRCGSQIFMRGPRLEV
jgi:hypothetical protein